MKIRFFWVHNWLLASLMVVLLMKSSDGFASIDWPMLGFTQVGTNACHFPVAMAHANDNSGRLFVAEQTGRIQIFQGANILPQPFMDISNRVLSVGAEQGLLGLAFPPNFTTKNYFYVDYTRQPDGAVVVSRFSVSETNDNSAATNSEQIILVIPKSYNNHNGGQIAFGPDGYLYIGVGDGGSDNDPQNNAQNPQTLLGKILRINVESGASPYAVPQDNPYTGDTNYLPEIWALGVCNPWRFSFDSLTGDLYIGDVGKDRFEEIDFQPANSIGGQNYGWRIMEGPTNFNVPPGFTNFSALTMPVTWYSHPPLSTPGVSAAVIGGQVYRGTNSPRLNGIYLYGDFISRSIWGLKLDGTNWQNAYLLPAYLPNPLSGISTFGEDDSGQIYVADYFKGGIYQIHDTPQVWTPTVSPNQSVIYNNKVVVSCLTTGAEIHYSTKGIPTISDPMVANGGTLQVVSGTSYLMRAFRSDLTPSDVLISVFSTVVGPPTFSPPAGYITHAAPITITSVTPNAVIYYTTDGTTPTTNSLVYSTPLILSGGAIVNAMGVARGYSNSVVTSASYSYAQVTTPVFNPSNGPITNGTTIAISCATAGSTIYYTTNGTTPTTNSPIYNTPLVVDGGTSISTMATAPGYLNSGVQSTLFQLVQTATPTFLPATGPITNGTTLVMSCATPGATIFYTLDGTTPGIHSSQYSGPIIINGLTTVQAIATVSQYQISLLNSNYYTLSDYKYHTVVTTLAGNGQLGASDGLGSLASFSSPQGICLDPAGNIYVADSGNNRIRKITQTGNVSTVVSNGLSNPTGVCCDLAGNLYVADAGSYRVLKIDPQGNISTFSGTGVFGYQDGPANIAQFMDLYMIKCDAQTNLYVSDWGRIRKIGVDGSAETLAGSGINSVYDIGSQAGLCIGESNYVYAMNEFGLLFQISPTGTMTTYAGSISYAGILSEYNDGPLASARFAGFYYPGGRDIANDNTGSIYIGDDYQVRKIDTNGWVSTLAGTLTHGLTNGNSQMARFSTIVGICTDTNCNIYISDMGNNCIRKISPDTAGIGIADDWQLLYFGHIGIDPNADPDHDGMSNYAEFWAGTNPLDANSYLAIKSLILNSGGHAQIQWQTISGKKYIVQYTDDLQTWNAIGSTVVGDGTVIAVSDPISSTQAHHRMYRVYLVF